MSSVRHSINDSIPTAEWTRRIRAGTVSPSFDLAQVATTSSDSADGVALLDAMTDSGFNLTSNPRFKHVLLHLALAKGQPEVLQYLWDIYSIIPNNDMLIKAIETRSIGGLEILRWLLDRHALDVNHMHVPSTSYGSIGNTDPRDRAEQEYAQSTIAKSRQRTALHAAISRGDTEVVKFLLQRGANVDIRNGNGQTALSLAVEEGRDGILQLLRNQEV